MLGQLAPPPVGLVHPQDALDLVVAAHRPRQLTPLVPQAVAPAVHAQLLEVRRRHLLEAVEVLEHVHARVLYGVLSLITLDVEDPANSLDGVLVDIGEKLLEVGDIHGETANCVARMECRAECERDAPATGGELPPSKPCACWFIVYSS